MCVCVFDFLTKYIVVVLLFLIVLNMYYDGPRVWLFVGTKTVVTTVYYNKRMCVHKCMCARVYFWSGKNE